MGSTSSIIQDASEASNYIKTNDNEPTDSAIKESLIPASDSNVELENNTPSSKKPIYVISFNDKIISWTETEVEALSQVNIQMDNCLAICSLNHWITWKDQERYDNIIVIKVYKKGNNFINGWKSLICTWTISRVDYAES